MKEDNMKQGWEIIPFEDSIVKVKYTTKVPSNDYLDKGLYPIVSQEEGLVCGYWNNANDLFKVSTPVVIFGDHTRILKYIDFDFVLGADGVKILQPIENINAKFLKYYLQYCKIPSLGYSRHYKLLKELQVPVPPLSVQEQIVSELDLLSGIIEKKREQLKEFDALAQSIFYDMFGDPITNEMGWEVKKLGEVCESVSYGTSNSSTENGEYKYLRMNNITYSGHIDITDIKYIDVSDDEYEKYVVRKGDILFNRTNSKDLVGKTALFNFEEEMIIAGYIIRVRVNQDSIIPTLVVKWLNTPLMKSYFKNICKGAVNQSNINSKELKNIPISIPPLPLQRQIASKIEAIERQKELIKQSISETETLFNARMQEHFG